MVRRASSRVGTSDGGFRFQNRARKINGSGRVHVVADTGDLIRRIKSGGMDRNNTPLQARIVGVGGIPPVVFIAPVSRCPVGCLCTVSAVPQPTEVKGLGCSVVTGRQLNDGVPGRCRFGVVSEFVSTTFGLVPFVAFDTLLCFFLSYKRILYVCFPSFKYILSGLILATLKSPSFSPSFTQRSFGWPASFMGLEINAER